MRTFVLLEYKNTKGLGWSDSANAIVTQQMGRFLGGFLQHNAAIIFKQAAKVSETCPDILFFDWNRMFVFDSRAVSDPRFMAPSIRKMGRLAFDS